MPATPVHEPPRTTPRPQDDGELLLARVRVAVADRYDGLREIGRGGMAVVYGARDRKLNRDIALKVLPPELAFRVDVRERFVREAQTAARLNHPSIVPIYAVDEADGLVYFAMPLVQGESLAARLGRERKPPLRFVRHVLAQVADALAYAHRSGVVHRDIKPDNILLEHATGRAVVTDFGIARAVQSGARLTQTGIAVGTPAFMSPEQAMGQRDVDGRSDVYALGLVGYLMLAGRLPFDAETSAGQLLQRVQGTPFPLANFRPDLPFSMVDAITRAIAREPSARWPDAASFAAALRAGDADDAAVERLVPAEARDVPAAPPRAPDLVRASVADALDRMNDSLAVASEQLRRGAAAGRAAALAVPAAPMRPPVLRAPRDAEQYDRPEHASAGGELRADRALRVLQDWKRRAKWVMWPAVAGVAGLVGVAATNGEPPMIMFMFGAGLVATVNALRLVRQTFRLRDVGLGVRDAIGERWQDKIDAMRGFAPAEAPVAVARGPISRLTPQQRIERARALVPAFVRRLKWTGGAVVTFAVSWVVGFSLQEPLMIPVLMISSVSALVLGGLSFRHWRRLRALGLTARDAFGDTWEAKLESLDDRPRAVRQSDELARLADDETLRSAYGRVLREAVDDRLTIRETWGKLDAADRELVPDVAPTADALLDRIVALATSLARLEGAVESHALPSLDQRIAEAQSATPNPDQERRLALLTRQRSSLAELVERQATLERQLDRASLALRSLRLDVVKLRALGIGSAIGDVTSATQEARAISADIGRALDVADELRRL
jgi:tRNA A-37 threonylcarbamoyl transferase component Bud32